MATSKKPSDPKGASKGSTAGPGFGATIKPYFTECYRSHMNSSDYVPTPFDLWSAAAVQKNWAKIKGAVQAGYMPPAQDEGCEGSWAQAKIAQFLKDFQAWKDGGFQP